MKLNHLDREQFVDGFFGKRSLSHQAFFQNAEDMLSTEFFATSRFHPKLCEMLGDLSEGESLFNSQRFDALKEPLLGL